MLCIGYLSHCCTQIPHSLRIHHSPASTMARVPHSSAGRANCIWVDQGGQVGYEVELICKIHGLSLARPAQSPTSPARAHLPKDYPTSPKQPGSKCSNTGGCKWHSTLKLGHCVGKNGVPGEESVGITIRHVKWQRLGWGWAEAWPESQRVKLNSTTISFHKPVRFRHDIS